MECSTHTWNMPPSLSTPQISPYVCFFFPLALCLSRQGVLESDLAVCCVATLKYCSYHLNGMPRYAHIGHPVMLTILLSTRHPYPPPSFSHCTFVGNMRRQDKKTLRHILQSTAVSRIHHGFGRWFGRWQGWPGNDEDANGTVQYKGINGDEGEKEGVKRSTLVPLLCRMI